MRGFIAGLFSAFVLSACEVNYSESSPPLRTIEFEIPEGDRAAVVRALQTYSQANGFRFAARTTDVPGSGQSVMFELRRRDLQVIGANEVLDPPRGPKFKNGRPQLGDLYSRTRFEVSFYRGTEPASAQFYESSTIEIAALLDGVGNVEIVSGPPPE